MGYIHFLAIVGVWRSPKQTWKILKEINRPMKDELPIEHGKLGIAMLLYYSVAFFTIFFNFEMWNLYVIIEWLVEARWLSDDILILEPHRPNIMNKCPGIEGPFIFINHISDDTIYISGDTGWSWICVACNRFWHVATNTYTVPPEHLFFWGLLPGMRPWRNWRSRRANVDSRFAIAAETGSWLREKCWKRGELRHFCWAHLMHLATGK